VKNTDTQDDEFQAASRELMVGKGLLKPKEGAPGKQPPPPNPKDVASAEKDAAHAKKLAAETEGVELANMEIATRMGVQMGESGIPMPSAPQPARSPSLPPENMQPTQGLTGQA
ncbi:MAG: hypothetical protein ACRCYS_11390, partial [Beijerinckiaceae bacterium]